MFPAFRLFWHAACSILCVLLQFFRYALKPFLDSLAPHISTKVKSSWRHIFQSGHLSTRNAWLFILSPLVSTQIFRFWDINHWGVKLGSTCFGIEVSQGRWLHKLHIKSTDYSSLQPFLLSVPTHFQGTTEIFSFIYWYHMWSVLEHAPQYQQVDLSSRY